MDSIEQAATSKPLRRRWCQFSLKWLMLVVLVLCGWLAMKFEAKREERAVVARLQGLGAAVYHDHFDWTTGSDRPKGPAWLRRLAGDDFFSNVAYVSIGGSYAMDAAGRVYISSSTGSTRGARRFSCASRGGRPHWSGTP